MPYKKYADSVKHLQCRMSDVQFGPEVVNAQMTVIKYL